MRLLRVKKPLGENLIILVGLFACALNGQTVITADDVRGWTGGEYRRYEPLLDSLEHNVQLQIDGTEELDFSAVNHPVYESREYRNPTPNESSIASSVNQVCLRVESLSGGDSHLDTFIIAYEKTNAYLRELGFMEYNDANEAVELSPFLNDTIMKFPLRPGMHWGEELTAPEYSEDWIVSYKVHSSPGIILPGELVFTDVLGMRIEYIFHTALGLDEIDTTYRYTYRWYSKSVGLLAELQLNPDVRHEELLVGGYESVLADFFSLAEDQRFLRVRQTINNSGAILYPKENWYAVSEERPITRAFTLNGRAIKPVADLAVFNTATQILVVQAAKVPELLPGL